MLTPLETAIQIAVRAHTGQLDADGTPHIVHCFEVMLAVKREYESKYHDVVFPYSLEELLIAAILHDTVEDSVHNFTALEIVDLERIRSMFDERIAGLVGRVSRREFNECTKCGKPKSDIAHSHLHNFDPKKEFYRDLIYRAREDVGSCFLKTADVLLNLSRTPLIKQAKWRDKLQYKYPIAHRVLNSPTPTSWEYMSWEMIDGKHYIADPNGKRKEITEEEAHVIRSAYAPVVQEAPNG